jgi:hypothetical protein
VRICRRIDGIPLGLELAAARLRSMSAGDLADRLDESFRILSGSAKTALPRQRTLQATIDWSHDLLEPEERAVFRRAAMFVGGFDLGAAEAVCSGDDVDGWAVVDHLDSLVDKSLLEVSHGEHARFRMLEPIRQFAQEQLQRSGESSRILGRHADHYRSFVATASPHTHGPDQMAWDRRLDADLDNVRIALNTFLEAGDAATHLSMAFDLYQYWMHVSLHVEAMETMHNGIGAAPDELDPELLVKAYFVIGVLGAEITDPKAIEPARRGLAIAEGIPDPGLAARAQLALGAALVHSGVREPGYEAMLAGQSLLDEHPEPRWWEPAWEDAHLRFLLSAYLPPTEPRKEEHADAAIAAFERLGDQAMLAASLVETFTIVRGRGAYAPDAAANIRRALDLIETIHLPYWGGHAHKHLGWVLMQLEQWDEAAAHLRSSLDPLKDCGDISCWINASGMLASSELATGEPGAATDRVRRALTTLKRVDYDPFLTGQILGVAAVALAKAGMGDRADRITRWLRASDEEELRDSGERVTDRLGEPGPGETVEGAPEDVVRLVETWVTG